MAVAYIALDKSANTDSYTLTERELAEPGIVMMNSGSANNLIVPIYGLVPFKPGYGLIIIQAGAGQTTVVAGDVTVTINVNSALTLKLTGQYSVATLINTGTNSWYLAGDLEAA